MATLATGGRGGNLHYRLTDVTANSTVSIPAGYGIRDVWIANTTANAVTGGVRIGTTDSGVDVVLAQTVGANGLMKISDAALLKNVFSLAAAQTLFIQAVVAWNSANLTVTFDLVAI